MPADAPPEPVYFALEIDDRKVHGITYRSTHRTKRAKLRLDTDGDGLLSDEREYIGTWLSVFRLQTIYEFGPVSIRHTGNGSKASRFYIGCADGKYVILYATHYREGQVKLDGRTHKIALVDCNYKRNMAEMPGSSSISKAGRGNCTFPAPRRMERTYPCRSSRSYRPPGRPSIRASSSSPEAIIARTRGEYLQTMHKVTAEPAPEANSEWKSKTTSAHSKSAKTRPGTQSTNTLAVCVSLSCISRRVALWRFYVTKSKARLSPDWRSSSYRSIPPHSYRLPSSYSYDCCQVISSPFLSQDKYFFDWLNDSLAYRMPSAMLFNNNFTNRSSSFLLL